MARYDFGRKPNDEEGNPTDKKLKLLIGLYRVPNYYAATPPCVRCAYKYMGSGKPCPCCGASWEEQIGGF